MDFRDRPAIFDSQGHRVAPLRAEVTGFWRRRRTIVQNVLLVIFLVLPWVRIAGEPAVLIDLRHRHFVFFGLKFFAHDGPMIFLLLGLFAISLALATALFGRIWCGWACPQTVFLDGVVRWIERWTEGTALERRALAAENPSFRKFRKKAAKWTLLALFSALLTHSFLAYFFGVEKVETMMSSHPSENPGAFLFVVAVTGLVLFDLGWFREQLCMIVCPYGRIQSVLMDRHTVTVQYDAVRGEPRKAPGDDPQKRGACVACNRCVNVCPTGIDIRNGIQMECVGCTACIDACDEIMAKTHQPPGLIAYRASVPKVSWLRPRVGLYGAIGLLLALTLVTGLARRREVDAVLLRAIEAPYYERVDDKGLRLVVDTYRLHLHNQTGLVQDVVPELVESPSARAVLVFPVQARLQPEESKMIPFLVEIPHEDLKGAEKAPLKIKIGNEIFEVEFVAPGN